LKKISIVSLVIIIISGMFLFAYNYLTKQEHSLSTYALSQKEINLIHNGDIILRHGYGMASDIIVNTLNEEYDVSHCAVISKSNNQINVIHSVSQSLSDFDGVQIQSLDRFITDCKKNSIIIVRYKNPKNTDNKIIVEKAAYYLSKKIPFDNDFDIEDSSKIYCTELIWRTIKEGFHEDIFKNQIKDKNNINQYKFQALWDTSHFEIIINHHLRNKINS